MTKLAIVESPGKVKTIKKYLGAGWDVKASVGHIRDLPKDQFGVAPPYFKPTYLISPDKRKVVQELQAAARKASEVYLATDDDREGEAIAFHLKEVLSLSNPKRVTFKEITPNSIKKAFASPRTIDVNKVAAQEGRRVLDRIVGYSVSGRLSELARTTLSAGRVQSVAVKLLYLREKERGEFRKRNYFEVTADIGGANASLHVKEWADDGIHLFDKVLATQIAKTSSLTVSQTVVEEKTTNPRPPLTTSTMQQLASSLLAFSPTDTMALAQSLYEQGLISYHRTDNPNLSPEAFADVCEYLAGQGITHQSDKIAYKAKESAQGAHEAIRPTDWSLTDAGDNQKEKSLYALIRERAICSALPAAVDETKTVEFITGETFQLGTTVSQAKFLLSGRVEVTKGWRALAKLEPANTKFLELKKLFNPGDTIEVECVVHTKETEPPARYTEASLIKALEKLGIGRPATYASIMKNIKDRGYYRYLKSKGKTEKSIEPTELGCSLVEAINMMTFMNLDFTRIVETQLDKIEEGKAKYLSLVTNVYETTQAEVSLVQIPVLAQLSTCPVCSEEIKRLESTKKGMKGKFFWLHTDTESSCNAFLIDKDGTPVVTEKVERITASCPSCGKPIHRIEKEGKAFWTHIDDAAAKKCTTFIKDDNGSPLFEKNETGTCPNPNCEKPITRKFSQAKNFHFWVHNDPKHADKCSKFIRDQEGRAVMDATP